MKNHHTWILYAYTCAHKSPGRRLDRLPSGRVTGSSGMGPGVCSPARRLAYHVTWCHVTWWSSTGVRVRTTRSDPGQELYAEARPMLSAQIQPYNDNEQIQTGGWQGARSYNVYFSIDIFARVEFYKKKSPFSNFSTETISYQISEKSNEKIRIFYKIDKKIDTNCSLQTKRKKENNPDAYLIFRTCWTSRRRDMFLKAPVIATWDHKHVVKAHRSLLSLFLCNKLDITILNDVI